MDNVNITASAESAPSATQAAGQSIPAAPSEPRPTAAASPASKSPTTVGMIAAPAAADTRQQMEVHTAEEVRTEEDYYLSTYAPGNKPLHVSPPPALSPSVLELLGRAVFRDPASQKSFEQECAILIREYRATTLPQLRQVGRLAKIMIDIRLHYRAAETAVQQCMGDAAREIFAPQYTHFARPAHGLVVNPAGGANAYGRFMQGKGSDLQSESDASVIKRALAQLAEDGLPPETLEDRARLLALDKTERLDRLIASKTAESMALHEQLLHLLDRIDRNRAIREEKHKDKKDK